MVRWDDIPLQAALVDVRVVPRPAIFIFISGAVSSLVLGHVILHFHHRAALRAPGLSDQAAGSVEDRQSRNRLETRDGR
jgi:hypothetical protein